MANFDRHPQFIGKVLKLQLCPIAGAQGDRLVDTSRNLVARAVSA